MTDVAAVKSIPLMTVTDSESKDDSLSADPVLQPEIYIDSELNGVKNPSLNKGVLPDDGNVHDPTLEPIETTLVMQRTASVAEMVTPVHQMKRSAEVNVERPSLLLGTGSLKQKLAHLSPLAELLMDLLRTLLLSTSILRICQRACPGFRWILTQICGHLLLMAAWFLKPSNKNGMLSSQAYQS